MSAINVEVKKKKMLCKPAVAFDITNANATDIIVKEAPVSSVKQEIPVAIQGVPVQETPAVKKKLVKRSIADKVAENTEKIS